MRENNCEWETLPPKNPTKIIGLIFKMFDISCWCLRFTAESWHSPKGKPIELAEPIFVLKRVKQSILFVGLKWNLKHSLFLRLLYIARFQRQCFCLEQFNWIRNISHANDSWISFWMLIGMHFWNILDDFHPNAPNLTSQTIQFTIA